MVFVCGFIATAICLAAAFDTRSLKSMFFVASRVTSLKTKLMVSTNWIVSWAFVATFCLQSQDGRFRGVLHKLSPAVDIAPRPSPRGYLLLASLWYLVTVFACISLRLQFNKPRGSMRTVLGLSQPAALYWVTTALVLAIDRDPMEAMTLVATHLLVILLYKLWLNNRCQTLSTDISRTPTASSASMSKVAILSSSLLLITAPLTASLIATTILIYAILNRLMWGALTPKRIRESIKNKGTAALKTIARSIMTQERSYIYLPAHVLAFVVPTFMLYIYIMERRSPYDGWFMVNPTHFLTYHLFRMGPYFTFFACTHAMVHIEAHASVPMFKGRWRIFNRIIEWWSFMFYGGVPEGYKVGHNKVHHKYNNGILDDSATLEYDRRSPLQFVAYLGKFYLFWSGLSVSWHLYGRGEKALAWKQFRGTLVYYGIMAMMLLVNWRFALAYWVYPHLEAVTLLAAINYTWHAWVDPKDPDNDYITSITILDGHYNTFEADFHVVHHQHPTLWYADHPKMFEKEIETYKKHKATVFRGTQAFEIFILIITNNLDRLATLFVDLSGQMSHSEIKELLEYRMSAIPPKRE
ncbi:hypothetical protein FOL47_001251 [Perkinsus chesapeaki]|uniref:Fatty acid desaturase domain-containing protein n=1 Tax=Perkinsus chesapeaki TaxID=330153 RepID=A0A7J6MJM8_PERCH|nr:hypothetical protein FOL47_001251 [Perkinsus chesapeaki]